MTTDFFLDKFEYDFQSNKRWCKLLEENEEKLNEYILKSFSHLINVHHIWVSRLRGESPESFIDDKLPVDYWLKLCHENLLKTTDYLNNLDSNEKVSYHDEQGVMVSKDSIDILYHILNHSNYHRAQVSRELRLLGITPPSFNFISFH